MEGEKGYPMVVQIDRKESKTIKKDLGMGSSAPSSRLIEK